MSLLQISKKFFRSFLGNAVPSFIARLFLSLLQALCLPALEQEGRQLRGHVFPFPADFPGIYCRFVLKFFENEGVVCYDDGVKKSLFPRKYRRGHVETVAAMLKRF